MGGINTSQNRRSDAFTSSTTELTVYFLTIFCCMIQFLLCQMRSFSERKGIQFHQEAFEQVVTILGIYGSAGETPYITICPWITPCCQSA